MDKNTIGIILAVLQTAFFLWILHKAIKERNAPVTTFALFFGVIFPLTLIYQNI